MSNAGMHQILTGDCREILPTLPDESVQCCVTSPPYYALRDYRVDGQFGMEKTPQQYVKKLIWVFREIRRILKKDGTLWLNLGDSYAGNGNRVRHCEPDKRIKLCSGYKPKDLIGIPWMVAFALRGDGWWLRSDIVWAKPNPMPESITDRPTRSHEYIFLLSKSARYFYDHEAMREKPSEALIKQIGQGYNGKAVKDYLGASVQDASATKSRIIQNYRNRIDKQRGHSRRHSGFNDKWDALTPAEQGLCGRNKRDVWTVATSGFKGAHFATFPIDLIRPCILAGSRPADTILDPFGGSCTTGVAATELGRKSIMIELNSDYAEMGRSRMDVTPGLPI
jgi:DNA modification methylase